MSVDVASIVLFSAHAEQTVAFYRALGVQLLDERHDEGPVHVAAELGGVHFAIYEADGEPVVAWHRRPGEVFVGFYVESLDAVVQAATADGGRQVSAHEQMPWGCRVLLEDPDGRTVEVNDRSHCNG
jgi:lactoylglutathione lyase